MFKSSPDAAAAVSVDVDRGLLEVGVTGDDGDDVRERADCNKEMFVLKNCNTVYLLFLTRLKNVY